MPIRRPLPSGTAVKVRAPCAASARTPPSDRTRPWARSGMNVPGRRREQEADREPEHSPVHHQIALARDRAHLEEIDAGPDVGARGTRQRGLLTDDGGQVRVERHHERLDLPAQGDVRLQLLKGLRGVVAGR